MIAIGDQLMVLKKVYSDEEMLNAFLTKTIKDCEIIQRSRDTVKKAFIIWITIALANSDYSDIERKAIKVLQGVFNTDFSGISIDKSKMTSTELACTLIGSTLLTTITPMPTYQISKRIVDAVVGKTHGTASNNISSTENSQIISDVFLSEVEDTLKTIAAVQTQMQNCNQKRYMELQKSYDDLNASLKDMIFSENN